MIRQSGYIPYEEIRIEFTGLRPGEKMYEELLLDSKTTIKTKSEKIFVDKTELIQFNQKAFDLIVDKALTNSNDVIQLLFEQLKLS
jgi:FlaA1/EpsC-like NDP-sugar epimerase